MPAKITVDIKLKNREFKTLLDLGFEAGSDKQAYKKVLVVNDKCLNDTDNDFCNDMCYIGLMDRFTKTNGGVTTVQYFITLIGSIVINQVQKRLNYYKQL